MHSLQKPSTQLVCYMPQPLSDASIACIVPLQGDACSEEKKYRQMLTGASSIGIVLSFMLVPRLLAGLYELIFNLCCVKVFVKAQGKTVKGVSLSVLILAALGVLVLLLIANGGSGFIGLRFSVWAATWLGSMVIVEPLTNLLGYFVVRCGDFKKQADVDAEVHETDDEENANVVGKGRRLNADETAPLLGHPAYVSSPSAHHIIETNPNKLSTHTIPKSAPDATQNLAFTAPPQTQTQTSPTATLTQETTSEPTNMDVPIVLEEDPTELKARPKNREAGTMLEGKPTENTPFDQY